MMPITNGHEVNVGCVAEGHRGWYAGQRVIEEAQGLGWELDAEGQAAVDRYYTSAWDPEDPADATFEIVVGQGGIVDEAENWLNDNTLAERRSDGVNCFWHGQWYTDDGHGTPVADEDVQRYVWHWHDGEFFLSPICEDGDCDDDTCAHWD